MDRHVLLTVLATVILCGAALPGVAVLTGRGRLRVAHRVARKVDLALDEPAGSVVVRRLARRELIASAVATLAAVVTLVVLSPVAASGDSEQYDLLWLVGAVLVGRAVGAFGAAVYETWGSEPRSTVRIARASSPVHGDYVAPIERIGAWVAAAFSVLVSVGLGVLDATGAVDLGDPPKALFVLAAVAPVVAVVLDEVVARRVLSRPQRAETALDLAWDDAMRARTLRDLVTVPLTVGALAPIVLAGVVGQGLDGGWPENPAVGLVSGIVPVMLLVVIAAGAVSIAQRPERYFRQRLWGTGDTGARP
jgi:hypothetical protein